MEWIQVKDKKPEERRIVIFLQPSTGKYFAGFLEREKIADKITNEGKEDIYNLFWVTATGHCKDMKDDDVWMQFPLYQAFKIYN
jgi:hypothetical protein